MKLANAGDEEAMVDVGLAYMDGTEFLAVNEQEAYRWFKKVADRDNTDGDYYLGMLLQNQENTDKRNNGIAEVLKKAMLIANMRWVTYMNMALGLSKI